MRRSRSLLSVALGLLLATQNCTCSTEYGECVGILEDKDPALVYEASVWNIVLAVLFSETALVPLVVVLDCHSCPRHRKAGYPMPPQCCEAK